MSKTIKKKSLKLSVGWRVDGDKTYRVEQVKNALEVSPGECLNKEQVEGFCRSRNWDVTIIPAKQGE